MDRDIVDNDIKDRDEKSEGDEFNEEYEKIIMERVQAKIKDWKKQMQGWKAGHIFDIDEEK